MVPARRVAVAGVAGVAGVLALGAMGFGSAARAQAAARAVQVAENVWFVEGEAALGSAANRNFISNAGFVVTGHGVVVVDALGSPTLADELLAQIRRVTPEPIRYVIVTHYHADHIYGLQVFKAAGATIVAHASGREYLQSDTAQRRLQASRQDLFPWIDEQTVLVAADRWIDADTVLRVGAHEFVIRHAGPAHTPEDLIVYLPKVGALFSGDLVFRGRIPFVGQADSRRWIESLNRVIEFAPVVMIPGHGPVSRQPTADLELTRDYLTHLRAAMGEAARNLEPFEDAYAKADWSRFEKLPLFRAANRMNAYNTYLLMEQQGGR